MINLFKELWAKIWNLIPKRFRNFYVLSGLFFLVWMLFLDVDNMYYQFKKYVFNRELKQEVKYYNDKIIKGNQELKGLKDDKEKLERFAREKYFMHKDSEDVYVIDQAIEN